jgi:ubiquinone/menaquinone biosynthesis C-methylase UbiE
VSTETPNASIGGEALRAEFDLLADEYHEQHKSNIAITGESPEYFAEYKVADLAKHIEALGLEARHLLDFGSGIGNSLPFLRKYFPEANLSCADVSSRSMEIARQRFPGPGSYLLIDRKIPLADRSQDIVFSACVFHHIPHEEHVHWLAELLRVTRPGGVLAIYEHNPLNPLTVRAVNTCPLDVNAKLITARTMCRRARNSGWSQARSEFKVFFPSSLEFLRPMEQHMGWLPLGGQYRIIARSPG